jgi:hypothetical protein
MDYFDLVELLVAESPPPAAAVFLFCSFLVGRRFYVQLDAAIFKSCYNSF